MKTFILNDYILKPLPPADWRLFREIRLEALATNPGMFGNSYALEYAFPDSHWQDRLSSPANAVWGLFLRTEIIGLTGLFGDADHPGEARLTTSFIQPEHRGNGLTGLFYRARIDWARAHGLKRLVITHRRGNEASRKAMLRAGFRHTHAEPRLWPDGLETDNLFYELVL